MDFSEVSLAVIGFDPPEQEQLGRVLADWSLPLTLRRDSLAELSAEGNYPEVVFIRIRDDRELFDLRTHIAEHPGTLWGCSFVESNRRLIFQFAHKPHVYLFFHPLDESELSIVCQLFASRLRHEHHGKSLCLGLKTLRHEYSWPSDAINVPRVATHLAEQLLMCGFCTEEKGVDLFAMAIEEALLNSLEHGNLELPSSIRAHVLRRSDPFEEEKARRLRDPAYKDRRVDIRLEMREEFAELSVRDQGKGFDLSIVGAQLAKDGDSPVLMEDVMKLSGRGLRLISSVFDRILYSDEGRCITMIKENRYRREWCDDTQRPE